MANDAIHAHFNLKYALEGRIVTMDAAATVIDRGRIFVKDGIIEDVRSIGQGYPDGFKSTDVIKSGGTIYPGMIELHNHLPYNILPYWVADKQYTNHRQWKGIKGYRTNVTGPMQTLGKTPGFPEAIVRYVECKSLVSGVTTSQGITLANSSLTKKVFHGLIRNVEETNEDILPEALTRIADVKPGNAQQFKDSLSLTKTRLLHLSEGIDEKARSFFTNLKIDDNNWAITNKLNGIHSTALEPEDFEVMGANGGSMTWSPMSNFVLYSDTTNMKAAKDNNVPVALGSDWSPSGSKNLLEELKVAYLVSKNHNGGVLFTDEELVRMVTSSPAQILGWENALGSLEVGMKADMLIVNGYQGPPYLKLIEATEKNFIGIFINGVPRCAQKRIFGKFDFDQADIEKFKIQTSTRYFYFKEADPDNILQDISFKGAKDKISGGLQRLDQLALDLENAHDSAFLSASDNPLQIDWVLIPDLHDHSDDLEGGHLEWGAGIPFSEIAIPLPLDKLTVVEDIEHFKRMAQHPIPEYVRKELPHYYDRPSLSLSNSLYTLEDSKLKDFNELMTLETFAKMTSNLSVDDKLEILNQAKVVLEEVYVHRILKKSMYAINPLDRIELMIRDIKFNSAEDDTSLTDKEFHVALLDVFSSLRDLHTRYILPYPFRNRFAFLPFLIEEFYETQADVDSRIIITTLFKDLCVDQPEIKRGLEVRYWNNVPIKKALELNSRNQSGSNMEARRARGLDTLTIRSLGTTVPPEEYRVHLGCYDREQKKEVHLHFDWMVSYYPPQFNIEEQIANATMVAQGFDYVTLSVNHVKAQLYGNVPNKKKSKKRSKWMRPSNNPGSMKGRVVQEKAPHFKTGYIRIYTFSVPDAKEFVDDFKEVLAHLEEQDIKGLVLDIRGNGGGLIPASELLLAALVDGKMTFHKAQFVNSELTLKLCEKYANENQVIDLSDWTRSIKLSKRTGDYYSSPHPITKLKEKRKSPTIFNKPMVLIIDALCYSAADMFAAGFQDNKLGKTIGTHANTGAGGANVWSHRTLRHLFGKEATTDAPLKQLPKGAGFNVAVRRILRKNGEPIEDLGISPEVIHKITKTDLLHGNKDLIAKAVMVLTEEDHLDLGHGGNNHAH